LTPPPKSGIPTGIQPRVTASSNARPTDAALVAGIIAIGTVLRFLYIGAPSLWLDEALSVAYAQFPWPRFVHVMQARELNMLPYYLILRGWIHLGTAEWIVRSLSAIFSVATLPLIYKLGTRLFGTRMGLISIALLALHPWHIRVAQEARGYSLMLLLVTASTLLFVRAIDDSARHPRGVWIAYVATSVLAAYTHFYASLALVAQWAALAIVRPRGLVRKDFAASVCAIAILLVPLAAFVLLGHADPAGWIPFPTVKRVEYLVYSLIGGDNTPGARLFAYPVFAVVLISAGAVARRAWRARGNELEAEHYALVIAGATLPIVLVLAASVIKPYFVDKYLIECLPFAALFVAIGVNGLRPRAVALGALSLTLLFSAHGTARYLSHPDKDDWRAATHFVRSSSRPGDAALFFPHYVVTPFEYYSVAFDSSRDNVEVVYPGTFGDGDVFGALAMVQHRYDRLWALFNEDGDAGVVVRDSLAHRYPVLSDRQFTGVRVVLYDTR